MERSSFTESDRNFLARVLDHLTEAAHTGAKLHRDLEHVAHGDDPHAEVTVKAVYQRLGVVVARLDTARTQLSSVLDRAVRATSITGGV